ncbi:hypothetical protein XENTR_v10009148 [Xenopus tropicalis]|nr:hypothetical protein XENTR_v10009148 [Xenopus tropicalis]
MAELLMECEEEDLEPWQQRIKEVEDDDDDELIFVREISGAQQPPARNTASFHPSKNHYKTASTENTIVQPVNTLYQPVTRPVTSSAIVQPLPRPVGSPEPIKRPLTVGLPSHLPPRPSPTILQPICRPVTVPSNAQPVCKNITFPATTQPAIRPVATITAQPVILNQGYIMSSSQVSSSNAPNVMYTLRPSTTLTQYQGVHPFTATENATQLVRPVQPLNQAFPVSPPTRTVPAAVHRPTPQMATAAKNLNLVAGPQQSLLMNSHKAQQGIQTQSSGASIGWNDNTATEKRAAPIEISDISPKKTKNRENECDSRFFDSSTSAKPPMLLQSSPTKVNAGTSSGTTSKHGPPIPQACPKCNIHFNLSEPMRKHMKFCCPDKVDHFFSGVTNSEAVNASGIIEDAEKGKLIMLVSDFYYGRYGGDLYLAQLERKTHTTFKCFSCHKILKNNIRFMNHMKHHLELEMQSNESWENHTTCHHCYRQFPTPFQLQCHIESSHTLYESSTICKICELSFESEQILLQHMKDNHKPGEMPYVCQVCGYRSSAYAEVDSHFRFAHENTKSLLCPFCLKVIKSGTPYMQHYMKHQNKGVYRCANCRLQFLTCKEKMDHKTQHHRTFRKPKQLEGLPPGTKVTIRASVGSIVNSVHSPTNTACTSPPSTALQASSISKITNAKITQGPLVKSNVQNTKPKIPPPKKKPVSTTSKKRIKMINTALRNLRSVAGYHKCIECQLEVKDFEGHFHTHVHCTKCKFSTSCNKAYTNHMIRFHGRSSSKQAKASKKAAKGIRSRNESLVGERHNYCKIMLYETKTSTNQSKGETNTLKTIKENSTSESSKMSDVQSNLSLHDIHVTPVEPVKDSDQTTQDGCNTNPIIGIAQTDSDDKGLMSSVEEETLNRDLSLETDHNLDNKCICDTANESKPSLEDVIPNIESPNPNFACEENSFVQFLRRRDEPESICSDVSEQSSVHLEPLTPSEVLEHEATEILQKGTATACHQIGAPCEQTDDTKEHLETKTLTEEN